MKKLRFNDISFTYNLCLILNFDALVKLVIMKNINTRNIHWFQLIVMPSRCRKQSTK